MRVRILGPLDVEACGESVDVTGLRLRALLVRLALDAGRTVSGEALGGSIWPGERPAKEANALQTLVSRLRRLLPDGVVRSDAAGYRLDVAADSVDALRFERLAGEGRRALRDGEVGVALRLLDGALGLWRGGLPEEVPDTARRRLEEARLAGVENRAEASLAIGALDGLVADLEALVAAHPLRERLRVLLIRTLAADGRRAEALSAYAGFRAFLAEELGTDPGSELRELHLELLRTEPAPAARPRGNLRASVSSFLGRVEELRLVRDRLETGRLVTLTGPGGVGKTRLAETAAGEFPGVVWITELAPVSRSGAVGHTAVAHAVVAALGIRSGDILASPRPPTERLAEALAGDAVLLVLDNCEHLIDEAAGFARELLGRCPGLRILATSREPMGIHGEAVCPVAPLAPGAAVALFTERARAARPGFAATPDEAPLVEEVCRRLDGLPLAIELAAARLRTLPLNDVAERLGDRFALLTRGDRTADPRHRTLRAVVAWSWDLLEPEERRLARSLAVFPGEITVASAQAVAAADAGVLESLADKSLLRFDGRRYRMLETIRAFGVEELVRSGELTRVRAAHAAHFTGVAEQAEPHLRGAGQLPWVVRLAGERGNLLAALRFACESGDAGTATRLCAALCTYWLLRGEQQALLRWTEATLEVRGEAPDEARIIVGTLHLLATSIWSGRPPGDGEVAEIRHLLKAAAHEPRAALAEAVIEIVAGADAQALDVLGRHRSHPDPWARAMALLIRAVLHGKAGAVDRMHADLEDAIAAFTELGERAGLAWALTSRADLRTVAGEDAVADLEEAVRLLRELDPANPLVLQRVWIAEARARAGDPALARRELLELIQQEAETGHLAFARAVLAELALREGDLDDAARHLGSAWDAARRAEDPQLRIAVCCTAADLAMARGDLATARERIAVSFELAVAVPDPAMAAVAAVRLARLSSLDGRAEQAAELLGAAEALIGDVRAIDADLMRLAPALRVTLGEAPYDAARTRGRDRGHDEVLALIAERLT